MLTARDLETFRETGLLHLPGLLDRARVATARASVQRSLAELGLWRDGALHLEPADQALWPTKAPGLRALGNRHAEVDALLDDSALERVARQLLDGEPYDRSIYPGPQLLLTLPNADRGPPATPQWHVDLPRLADGALPGVQLFAMLDDVLPGGGGTLTIAGSHRPVQLGRFVHNKEIFSLLRRDAGMRALLGAKCPVAPAARAAFMAARATVEGVDCRIVELTGAAGDAWFVALGVIHSGAPNGTDRARIMATYRYMTAARVAEVSSGFGWDKQSAAATMAGT